ncbi:MAG: putative sugar nucleotidyl transferase [Planctomycetota bacterium]
MGILLLEDVGVERLAPMTLLRPAFEVGCGGWSLKTAVQSLEVPVTACVRPRFNELVKQQSMAFTLADQSNDTLIVNARLVPSIQAVKVLGEMLTESQVCVACAGEHWAAVRIPESASDSIVDLTGHLSESTEVRKIPRLEPAIKVTNDLELFEWPFHVIKYHKLHMHQTLSAIANRLITKSGFSKNANGAVVADNASISPHAVLDTSRGPIVVMENAEIGPMAFLRGPVLLGPNSRVNEHASVKDGVMLGNTARVGGELHNSIVESFSNKQHHGFLGDSYVGAWVNLGAGTTNSNLKNTYGTIRVSYPSLTDDATAGPTKIETGMQFLGIVVGDYSKTAINASIYTGLTIGVCSNVYGTVPTNVPSFVNYAAQGGSITEVPADVSITTHERMHLRRNVPVTDSDRQLVREAFRITAGTRAGLESGPPRF